MPTFVSNKKEKIMKILQSYSFDDNYAYNFSFNKQENKMIFSFETYYDENRHEEVFNPCKLVIKNWSLLQLSYDSISYEDYSDDKMEFPKCELILDIKEFHDVLYLHVMTVEDKYLFLKIYNAMVVVFVENMNNHINVYNSLDKIIDYPIDRVYIAMINSVKSKDDLLRHIKESLHVPFNISWSWTTLASTLSSPFWLLGKWQHVTILHKDISKLPETDIIEYLSMINYCRLHSIRISFIFNNDDINKIISLSPAFRAIMGDRF